VLEAAEMPYDGMEAAMSKRKHKPVVVGPQPFSFDDILRNVDPAPDDETERFVAAIYADRRGSAEQTSPE
jgi:hypothetical protein